MQSNQYIETLRQLCAAPPKGVPPYLLRTRFERNLYGAISQFAQQRLGNRPRGLTRNHVEAFLKENSVPVVTATPLRLAADVFERFKYLCDTSNWSNDGQDPRLEACRQDILCFCDLI